MIQDAGSPSPVESAPAAPPYRVLVVDASTSVRERLVRLLGDLDGVSVVGEAAGAAEAIALAGALQPNFITLDLDLYDGSAFAVLRSVLASPVPPVVAVVTNYAGEPVRRQCLTAGAKHFFDKSLEFEVLADTVARLAAGRGTSEEGRVGQTR
jgi:two-component system OmpR family response regulator